MQISKNFFVICALALLVSAPPLRAAESEAQAKAREALRKKMSELDAQEKGAPAPARIAPAATPPAGVVPAGPGPAAAPAPSRVDDEAAARARDATRQKLRELNAQQFPGSTPAPSAQVAPPPTVPAAVPVAAVPRQAGDDEATARAREAMRQKLRELDTQQFPGPASAPSAPAAGQMADTEANERARAALRQKMAELDAQQPASSQPWPGDKHVTAASRPELKPLPAPPSPFSGPKEARLADLLRQYKADEISPEQYHQQRAKILTEP